MATMKMPCAVGSGASELEFTADNTAGDTTSTLSLDGNADYYFIGAYSNGAAYWSSCNITSVTNGTYDSTAIREYSYGTSKVVEWVVKVTQKGSPVSVNFTDKYAQKWATAINLV